MGLLGRLLRHLGAVAGGEGTDGPYRLHLGVLEGRGPGSELVGGFCLALEDRPDLREVVDAARAPPAGFELPFGGLAVRLESRVPYRTGAC